MQPAASLPQRIWANAYLLLTLTTLLWAGNAVASRLAVGHIAPMTLTSLRWVLVCAVMPYLFRQGLREHWPVLKANWLKVTLLGTFGFTAFNTLMYIAAYSTTAINIGILQGSIPVFVLLGAFLAFRTPIGGLQALGVSVTILGVLVTASRGDWHTLLQLSFVPGDLWMIIACLLYRRLHRRHPHAPAHARADLLHRDGDGRLHGSRCRFSRPRSPPARRFGRR